MSRGKRRCSKCKYDFIPHNLPLRLTRDEWKHIIRLFLMEQNSNSIIDRTQFERRRVFRALTKIRIVLAKDVPEIFSGSLKLMKRMSEDNGKTNESRFVIMVLNGEEGPRNNRYLGSFAGTVRSGPKSLMTLKLKRFNHLSQEKYQLDLPSVLILGKLIPGLPQEGMFIVSSIMVNDNTLMEMEIISMVWRDSGDFSSEN